MKAPTVLVVMLVVLVATVLLSMLLGRYPLSLADLQLYFSTHLLGQQSADIDISRMQVLENILMDIRLPRIVAALLIGASLSVAGVVFQSMFINPLVSPGVLGVLSGASFGAAVGMIAGKSWLIVQLGAFSCGLLAVTIALSLALINRGDRLLMLILGGIISGAMFTALLSVVKYLADPYEQLPAIVYWLMGGLSATDARTVLTVSLPMVAGILLLLALSGYLNVMSMGDEEARSLGVNVTLLRLIFIFLATIISALTVILGGIIGWVGLLIPHIARMMVGPDNRLLLPAAALVGATYLVIADDIARLLFSVEIPIGILTSLIGIPFFAFVLARTRKGWG
ncbi:FecCD family ABC transporter permease [Pelobacter seleniigenes]|uniref:FecCD family ABC transporter permease n=1 Tax=Pelobacter seleniigenes TaxID=407188 RepID=UPI0004A6FF9B|nr:iron ABC transporter permease [Pelobacter seleniigenes]